MHSTGSFLYTALERVKAFVDESENSKYDHDFLVRHLIQPSIADVIARLTMTEEAPLIARTTISLVVGQEYYQLPPVVREVIRLAKFTAETGAGDGMWLTDDWSPGRSEFSIAGAGWRLDGNTLRFNPTPKTAEDWSLWFLPSSSVLLHYSAADGAAGDATSTTSFTLAATPTLGVLDRREAAYQGCMLRVLQASGVWQERVIESYVPSTRVCTLRRPLLSLGATTGIRYEVGPYLDPVVWEAVVIRAAHKLATWRRLGAGAVSQILTEYTAALKTARDTLGTRQSRTARVLDLDTIDREPWDM